MAKLRIDYLAKDNGVMHQHKDEDVDSEKLLIAEGSQQRFTIIPGTNNTTRINVPTPDPTNLFSNGTFDNNDDDWVAEVNNDEIPAGWIKVPGNELFNTKDFLVMKYEAKAWTVDGEGNPVSVVADGGASSAGWAGVKAQTTYRAASTAEGRPWVNIAQTHSTNYDSKNACAHAWQLAGLPEGKTHLINNNEWMTIARNATNVSSNWTGNSVGSGALYSGHNDGTPGNSLAASTDNDGYYGTGQTTPSNQRRTLTLSNGKVIWDLAGNVYQWTDNLHNPAINTTGAWVEWNHANVAAGAIDLYGPPSGYLSAAGMGQIYGGVLNNAFLRGGRWDNTSDAGVFALNLGSSPASQYHRLGFRCASDSVDIFQSYLSSQGRGDKSAVSLDNSDNILSGLFAQELNLSSTIQYTLIAYVKATTIDSNIVQIYANGAQTTYYTPVGDDWYKLETSFIGADSPQSYGLIVKAGKEILVDEMSLIAGRGDDSVLIIENENTGNSQIIIRGKLQNEIQDGNKSATIIANASQDENILEIQNSSEENLVEIDKDGIVQTKGYKSIDGSQGQDETVEILTDVRDNAGQTQKKTQQLTFKDGLLTEKSAESDWTDTTDI